MRKTYRYSENQDYWEKRWGDIPADIPMENTVLSFKICNNDMEMIPKAEYSSRLRRWTGIAILS